MAQVIVTSYRRLKYLRQCLTSLQQDGVEIYVCDGGSDQETVDYIRSVADGWLLFKDNPGADYLKTRGIQEFVFDPQFIVSSDDLIHEPGFADILCRNWDRVNKGGGVQWAFCASNLPAVEWRVSTQWPSNWGWKAVNGVELLEVSTSQVAGSILDYETTRKVGYFPVYGRSGQGDWAISKRFRDLGKKCCYFRHPMVEHIGKSKKDDFPEYAAEFEQDESQNIGLARTDSKQYIIPVRQVGELGYRKPEQYWGSNTPEYWNSRFSSGHWSSRRGEEQSRSHVESILNYLSVSGMKVLDIGCALGNGTELLHQAGAQAVGADLSAISVDLCRKRYPDLRFEIWDIRNVPEFFDVIITAHTLEHLGDDAVRTVRHLRNRCKTLVFSLPSGREWVDGREHVGDVWDNLRNRPELRDEMRVWKLTSGDAIVELRGELA